MYENTLLTSSLTAVASARDCVTRRVRLPLPETEFFVFRKYRIGFQFSIRVHKIFGLLRTVQLNAR